MYVCMYVKQQTEIDITWKYAFSVKYQQDVWPEYLKLT